MASALTSTSSKSGFLYLMLLALVVVGTFYLFLFRQPSAVVSWQKQAFKLNAAAFTNGIHLSNLRFVTNNSEKIQIDWWLNNGIGLDYNSQGYPIGTDITENFYRTPQRVENCQQIWRFVLGPLQPEIYNVSTKKGYWVELSEDKTCIYRAYDLTNLQLSYHSSTGKVLLTE